MTTQRTFSAEEIQKKIGGLPNEVKSLLYSDELSSAIQKVGEKNKLHYDQMGRLELETTNVMLGLTAMEDFAPLLMSGLEVDRTKADAIIQDLNDQLFNKIRDAMKKVHEQNAAPTTVVAQNPPAVEKSVVMPSQMAAMPDNKVEELLPAPAPTAAQTSPAPVPPTPKPAPVTPPSIPAVDAMLTEPTVSLPNKEAAEKPEAPKPAPMYKADPYREPPE